MFERRSPRPANFWVHAQAIACVLVALGSAVSIGCGESKVPVAARPEQADRWFKRAERDFNEMRVDDAHDAITRALAIAPDDPEIRMLGGRIALVRLEFDESLRLMNNLQGSEAHSLRGRAYWYRGELAPAADELDLFLDDPDVRDDWAKAVSGLARRGEGREPFTISGEPRAVVEMAHVSDMAPYLVVPVEIDGEDRLALVATGNADVVVDSATFAEPSWVSLRFKGRRIGPELIEEPSYLEVTDVPALTQDLTGISKDVNAPITALIGVSMLRRLNATIDYAGHQFVVRQVQAQPPPSATKVNLYYGTGGSMMMSTGLGGTDDSRATLYIDSMVRFPLTLDDRGWVKAGLVPNDLQVLPQDPNQKLRGGTVPTFKLGAFHIDSVPGVYGAEVADIEKGLRFDIDGVVGVPILARYRITFGDGGRVMYLEDDTELMQMLQGPDGGFDVDPAALDPNAPQPTGPLPGAPVNQGQSPILGPSPLPQLPGPGPAPGPTP